MSKIDITKHMREIALAILVKNKVMNEGETGSIWMKKGKDPSWDISDYKSFKELIHNLTKLDFIKYSMIYDKETFDLHEYIVYWKRHLRDLKGEDK